MRTIAVIGASLAGLSAARALRGHGFDGRLVLVGDERHRPYDRPPLSKGVLAGSVSTADLALETEGLDLQWRLGSPATRLDVASRSVELADGARIGADGFVVATGASARSLPGSAPAAGVHTLRTLDDAVALRADLRRGGRLIVVGAGFIGAETASTARGLGLEVTVVEAARTPLAGPLGPAMGHAVSRLHEDHGVRLRCGTGVRRLTGKRRVSGVELVDGTHLRADVVVVGVGAVPNTGWLAGSGLTLDDGVRCGPDGSTEVPGVVAVGDCAAWYEPVLRRHHRVEHWTGALERPRIAAATLLGATSGALAAPPYFWSDQYGVRIQFAGHAQGADDVSLEAGDVDSRSFLAVYRRDGHPVAVLGLDQVRLFTRWRRSLAAPPLAA